ncbi:M48 family metallopeptidase [Metamycoplasma faucium]|uniref:M48 family metallopeptidase n=1 Tax=Metamycoplasma faucium TaxID=56142 RepID=A0ABZ2TLP7_9BACT
MKTNEKIVMFKLNEKIYPIKVLFTNNRNVYFEKKDNIFILKINKLTSLDSLYLKEFMEKSIKSFLAKKDLPSMEINENEKYFYYLGKKIFYELNNDLILFNINDEIIQLRKTKSVKPSKIIWNFLNEKLLLILDKLIIKNIPLIYPKLKKYELKVLNKKSAWGTNYVNKALITFSKYLILFNINIIEYVVIHELVHFLHQNHSKKFWQKINLFCLNYKEKIKALNEHIFDFNLK